MIQQIAECERWVELLLSSGRIHFDRPWVIDRLEGDASCRQYFRLQGGDKSYILAYSPLDKIDNGVFIQRAKEFEAHRVNVPSVVASDSEQGFMLLSDLGNNHLFDRSEGVKPRQKYYQAIDQLLLIQQATLAQLPKFDSDFLYREMSLFGTWLIDEGLSLAPFSEIESVYQFLIDSALSQPQVTMHRDFHSKNLLLVDATVWVIDFQDVVQGPISYDLASLLKDCYLDFSDDEITCFIDYYLANSSPAVSRESFVRWFDLIGMQRHLKVLGLFIRLSKQEGKHNYLQYLPRVYQHVMAVSAKYPPLAGFHQWLHETVSPALIEQPWYQK